MRIRRVEVHPDAKAEFDASQAWYQKRSLRAARRFVAEVDRAIARASESPLSGVGAFIHYRKRVIEHFPFCVFYQDIGDAIWVLAIAHESRTPGYWLDRNWNP